jgi:outer membrane protein insertion porin family
MYFSSGISLFAPFFSDIAKSHVFVNAGNSALLPDTISPTTLQDAMANLINKARISAGIGIAVRFSFLRAEINYCVPISSHTNDRFKQGVQFGLGVNFL